MQLTRKITWFTLFSAIVNVSYAQELTSLDQATKQPELALGNLIVRPLVIEGSKTSGATIGLDYEFSKSYFRTIHSGDANDPNFHPDAVRQEYVGNVSARGTVAASEERNPNNFLDFAASYSYARMSGPSYFLVGVKAKFETDQGFDNKQYVASLSATYTYVFENMAFLGVTGGFGRVNPNEDKDRKAALGNGSMGDYNRADFETFFKFPLSIPTMPFSNIEFNYRHYQEINPPSAISAASLGRYRFGALRLNLNDNFFLQYGKGKLPFDKTSERVVKIGWTYKFM